LISNERGTMTMWMRRAAASLALGMAFAQPALAQQVKVYGLVELSGTGATSGTNFNDGVKLAVKEINGKGGILGRKVDYIFNDTQSQPQTAKALAVKAVDDGAYVVMGPVFSGSILVSMAETRRAEIPNFTGGEAAPITQQANADALFVYCNEEESARALRELKKQGYDKPIIGETVLTSQKVIELAADAANGAVAHVGLTADAPDPLIKDFAAKFQKEHKYKPDHNGLKGYTAMYVVKAVTEKVGKLDPKAFAKAMHGVSLSAKQYPGILMDVSFDDKGDLDRESFMTKVVNGKQEVVATLPPASAK